MGRITSNVGLITGIPITETVNQLLQISARTRDSIVARNTRLQTEGDAIAQLTASTLAVQFAAKRLSSETLFTAKSAVSSNAAALSVSVTGSPAAGTYQFTPVRSAQTQHSLSSGFASLDGELTPGTLSLRHGGFVNESISLAELNSGLGVPRGKIRITDRSGTSTEVDLRFAQSVDDVLEAINNNGVVAVTATTLGDRFQLADNSGSTSANLRVQEVGNGTTAAALGLAGINVSANSALGQDTLKLHNGLALSRLNDGNGVSFNTTGADLVVQFRDNSAALNIDFQNSLPAPGVNEKTIGDLLATINAADPARLRAEISADGDSLRLIDLTADSGGAFSVASVSGGTVAEDLGLTGTATAGVVTSRKLQSGLKTTLLSTFNGGSGLGTLGLLNLTDRSGASASVDLSTAQSLDDVLDAINSTGLGIRARVNDARNGLLLVDETGATASNLIAANGDATNTADKLGLAVNAAATSKNGGSLQRQVISEQTTLASLRGGQGIAAGSILITDSAGQAGVLQIDPDVVKTVGDVVAAINELSNGVEARLNSAGDGILLFDTAGGAGELSIREVGSGRTAADLRLLGDVQTALVDGISRQVVDGSTTLQVSIDAGESLQDLIDKINALDAGVTAAAFNDGSSATPFRLSLLGQTSGRAGAVQIDGSQAGISFENLVDPQDALLVFGGGSNGTGFLVSSSTGRFDQIVDGLSLSVGAPSTDPVSITVAATNDSLVSAVNVFVDQYNKLRDKLKEFTFFNADSGAKGPLFGTLAALRIDTQLSNLLSSRFFGVGSVQSLAELGLSLDDEGKLSVDADKLRAEFAERPDALKKFFTDENLGLAHKLDVQLEQLVGVDNSLLVSRSEALQQKIDFNNERIAQQNVRLDRERERLLKQFNALESAIAKIKSNQSALDQIQFIGLP